jgi:RNA polymerase sigma-70 factor (ECF subfamily)
MGPETDPQSGDAVDARIPELREALARSLDRVCPSWLADQKDDILQEATIKMLDLLRRDEQERELNTFYLRKVAYSAMVDVLRRRRGREFPVEDEILQNVPATSRPGPDRELKGRELGRAIQACLGALNRPRRLAVALHLYGYGREESVAILRWPDKRVDNLRYRGLADLRRCLTEKGFRP